MKTTALLFLLVLAICAGCVSRYDVTLTNGDIITAKGKPHLNHDKNMWIFKNVAGRTNYIPAANVSQVAPQTLDADQSSKKFNPVQSK